MDEKFDLLNYDQGPKEVIKYMDYLPEDDDARMAFLMGFINKALGL